MGTEVGTEVGETIVDDIRTGLGVTEDVLDECRASSSQLSFPSCDWS